MAGTSGRRNRPGSLPQQVTPLPLATAHAAASGLPTPTMNTFSISQLARQFGLSRSTLLYYDRIGLLKASDRTAAGYRTYSQAERSRLERICTLRRTGLPLSDVHKLLTSSTKPSVQILEKRLQEMDDEIAVIRTRQQLTLSMLKKLKGGKAPAVLDKATWVRMLKSAGMDEKAMARWHAEFEATAPKAHHAFLLSLGIPEAESLLIRQWAQQNPPPRPPSARDAPAPSRQISRMRQESVPDSR